MPTIKANPEGDLVDFTSEVRLYGQHGKGVNKSLDAVMFWDGEGMSTYFKVSKNKVTIIVAENFQLAVNGYNKTK